MNYGIKEIEEFKAPSKRPWLVIAALVILAIVIWQSVRLLRNLDRRREARKDAAETENRGQLDKPKASPADDSLSSSRALTRAGQPERKRKPPVDLKTTEPAPIPSRDFTDDMARAKNLIRKGDRVAARELLLGMLEHKLQPPQRTEAETLLGNLNVELAFLPYDMPEKLDHVVKRGDSLDKISKKYGVTVESIQIGNALKNPDLIKAGDHLRVLDADFSIVVHKGSHDLLLKMNDRFFKRYGVGLGKFDKTPLGTFEIYDRIVKPVWWRPDGREIPFGHEENILGTRWMAIRATGDTPPVKGYGIHGTWDEASIGKSESAGCVRMRNADVEELFNLVPLGTKVTIVK